MNFAVTDSFIYLPPLILAGLLALYKNNILCFWECNPVGVSVKQFTGLVAMKISAFLEMAKSTAVSVRNFPTFLTTFGNETKVLIMNTIQGILLTIKQTIRDSILQAGTFLAQLLVSFGNSTASLKKTVLDFFRAPAPEKYSYTYLFFLSVALLACFGVVWYGYHKAKNTPVVETIHETIEESVKVETKKPIRRRSKKRD